MEQGQHANLRRVDKQMCNTSTPATTYPQSHAAEQRQDRLKANSEQEATVAYQKMKALCSR